MTGCSLKYAPASSNGIDKKEKSKTTQTVNKSDEKAETSKENTNGVTKADTNSSAEPNNTPTVSPMEMKDNTESIPVLTYHSVGNTNGNQLIISPELLDKEMQWLKDNGYTTLTLAEAYRFFSENKPVPKKSVVLTFDDGYVDNYTHMYPILKKYGFKATIFVITDSVDKNSAYLTSTQLKELESNGIAIESHTVDHKKLETLSYQNQLEEMKNSKLFLEGLLKKKVDYIAYPFGTYNDATLQAAKEAGYTMALSMDQGWSNKNNGIYKLHRVYISAFYDMNTFEKRVTNPQY
jgi:peptidoglycan/xylan/chitin deacetylase (PgdA/CDA1 family)